MIQLNPGFKRSATNSGYKLILPIENVEQFSENLMHSPYRENTMPSWKHYRMKPGDTLFSVARKFKTTTDEIRKLNHLGKANLRRGTNLLIPNNEDKPASLAMDEEVIPASPVKKSSVRSKKKDSSNVAMRITQKLLEAEVGSTKNYHLQPGDTIYMVRNTDTLEKIATRFHISTNTLKAANKIQGHSVTPGKQIIIPTHTPSTSQLAAVEDISSSPSEKTYIVRRGDTIAKIAKRFNTSPASIRLANLIDDSNLLEGIKLTIPSPVNS